MQQILGRYRVLVLALLVGAIAAFHFLMNRQSAGFDSARDAVAVTAGLSGAFLLWLLMDSLRQRGNLKAVRAIQLTVLALMLPLTIRFASMPGGFMLVILLCFGLGNVLRKA